MQEQDLPKSSWDQPPQAHRAADQPQGEIERQAEVEQDAHAVAGRIRDLDLDGVQDGLQPDVENRHLEIDDAGIAWSEPDVD